MERAPDDTSVGIGIGGSNVNRRLQLLYGEEHGIQMAERQSRERKHGLEHIHKLI
jgi:LytS/YehU family sensor histidine kinase